MISQSRRIKPVLKVGEYCVSQGGGAFLYLEEDLGVADIDKNPMRIAFDKAKSFEEVQAIRQYLLAKGVTVVL